MNAMMTPILNSLNELANLTVRLPRHVALQPSFRKTDELDLGRFLSPAVVR